MCKVGRGWPELNSDRLYPTDYPTLLPIQSAFTQREWLRVPHVLLTRQRLYIGSI